MIIDKLKNCRLYDSLGKEFETAFEYLRNTDLTTVEPGRYELEGSESYVLAQTYESKAPEKGRWEAHRQHADIQCIVEGVEKCGWANIDTLKPETEYDPAKDVQFLSGQGDMFILSSGSFVVFLPHDAHMPSLAAAAPQQVKKVVVKVRLGS